MIVLYEKYIKPHKPIKEVLKKCDLDKFVDQFCSGRKVINNYYDSNCKKVEFRNSDLDFISQHKYNGCFKFSHGGTDYVKIPISREDIISRNKQVLHNLQTSASELKDKDNFVRKINHIISNSEKINSAKSTEKSRFSYFPKDIVTTNGESFLRKKNGSMTSLGFDNITQKRLPKVKNVEHIGRVAYYCTKKLGFAHYTEIDEEFDCQVVLLPQAVNNIVGKSQINTISLSFRELRDKQYKQFGLFHNKSDRYIYVYSGNEIFDKWVLSKLGRYAFICPENYGDFQGEKFNGPVYKYSYSDGIEKLQGNFIRVEK